MANVNVTYQDMHTAAKNLESGKADINAKLGELQKLVKGLVQGGYVTDSSSAQFDVSYEEFNKGATDMMEGLTGMSGYLSAAATAFSDADQQLAAALKR